MLLDCNEIEDRLWVGGYVRAEDVSSLRQLGITTVISLQSDRDLESYHISLKPLMKAYELAGIEFLRIPVPDFDVQALETNLSKAVEELEKALAPLDSRVYVHCTAGVNRGPTLAAAYLIKSRKFSAREAFDFVLERRDCNPYLDMLESYAESIGDSLAGRP